MKERQFSCLTFVLENYKHSAATDLVTDSLSHNGAHLVS